MITLRRGFTHDIQLWTWHEAVRSGQASSAVKSVSLIMYNADGKPVARYALENAWPSKLEVGALKASASEVMTETVTPSCDNIHRVSP